jgi:hypothetical protein
MRFMWTRFVVKAVSVCVVESLHELMYVTVTVAGKIQLCTVRIKGFSFGMQTLSAFE